MDCVFYASTVHLHSHFLSTDDSYVSTQVISFGLFDLYVILLIIVFIISVVNFSVFIVFVIVNILLLF